MPVLFFWPIMATYFYIDFLRECNRLRQVAEHMPAQAEILFFPERKTRI